MDSQNYLFVNLTPDKRSRDRKLEKEVRTHVMQDIGKARRKRRRNMQITLELLRSPSPPLAQSRLDSDSISVVKPVYSTVRSLPGKDLEVDSHTSERSAAIGLSRPFWTQKPLQILDDSWGMDPFAFYTMALVLNGNMTSQCCILNVTS